MTIIEEIEYGEDGFIEVYLSAEVNAWDNGIGSYEYWGCKGYDTGYTEYEVYNLKWDESKFSDAENKIIQKHIADNWKDIEESFIKKFNESLYEDI